MNSVRRVCTRCLVAIGLAVMLVVGVLLGSVVAPSIAAGPPTIAPKKPPFRIALANSYIGNTWRIEMENLFKAGVQMPPYNALVKSEVFNSGNNVPAQIQQMDNLISSKVDAIVINAASPTGLNGVIAQACAAGILVVSYDNVVTAPCAVKVNTDQFKFGEQLAEFIAKELGGKGNVIMDTGVPGTHVDEQRNAGADSVWKKNPGLKVLTRFSGMWDSATSEQRVAPLLATFPKIDAVWAQGGTDGVINAFLKAHRKLPVIAGEAENGFRVAMVKYKDQGFRGISIGQPPYLVLVSLALAVDVLQGKRKAEDITIPFPVVTSDNAQYGVNAFPKLQSSFFDDFAGEDVPICVDAAVSGKPCPGTLTVRLP
jgi:ribose transport system substrate-binding protein